MPIVAITPPIPTAHRGSFLRTRATPADRPQQHEPVEYGGYCIHAVERRGRPPHCEDDENELDKPPRNKSVCSESNAKGKQLHQISSG